MLLKQTPELQEKMLAAVAERARNYADASRCRWTTRQLSSPLMPELDSLPPQMKAHRAPLAVQQHYYCAEAKDDDGD